MVAIRLVSFDALHTILALRLPIDVQYSQTFAPFLGVLEPESLKRSFKIGMYLLYPYESSRGIASQR